MVKFIAVLGTKKGMPIRQGVIWKSINFVTRNKQNHVIRSSAILEQTCKNNLPNNYSE